MSESWPARSGPVVNALLLFWMVGTLLAGKTFCYLSAGPIYITEAVLACLIASNIRRLTLADLLFLGAISAYFVAGMAKWGQPLMAGKDLAWLYYLLFLRFFPSNFPERYCRVVAIAAAAAVPLQLLSLIFGGLPGFTEKYRVGVIFLFLLVAYLKKSNNKLTATVVVTFMLLALISEFKTLLFMTAAAFLLSRLKGTRMLRLTPIYLFGVCTLLAVAIRLQASEFLLKSTIDTLNFLSSGLGFGHTWDTGTSQWRAEIWSGAIRRFFADDLLVFGELPGHNFLDWRLLGMPDLQDLTGGESLGVVRTPHNIVVLILMRTGFVGLGMFIYYYWRWLPKDRYSLILNLCVFVCALSSDILEVPSRGPLLYSLTCLIASRYARQSSHRAVMGLAEAETPEAAIPIMGQGF